jgi:hypothetical protein
MNRTDAINAQHGQIFYHVTSRNADGTASRVRVSGRCKTWKTRPEQFSLPVKHGLYVHLKITQDNAHEFLTKDPTDE